MLFAQEKTNIEILNADFTYFDQKRYPDIRRLIGNVEFKHKGAIMSCDSAWHYFKTDQFKAFNNISINQGDSIFLTGNFLNYDGKTKNAVIRENITLKDNSVILHTDELEYSIESSIASYKKGASITDADNILTSIRGNYLSAQKLLIFKEKVVLVNPDYTINSDTLHYQTMDEIAYFFGPTTIDSDENIIYCENGWYNTITDISQFSQNAYLWNNNQQLSGDSLYYDRNIGYGLAVENIEIKDTLNDFKIFGERAEFFEYSDSSIITENPLFVVEFDEDTLYMHADTIVANLDSSSHRQIKAYSSSKFYSDNLSGKCKELYYYTRDSTIQLYNLPVLWSDDYQLSSDHIVIFLNNNTIERLELQTNAFILSKDSLNLFNQIKGKNMFGFFKRNSLYKINVMGNGQTVYVIKDEQDKLSGINTIYCSKMNITVNDKNIDRISFQNQPSSIIYPIEELPIEWKRLEGFKNRLSERILTKEDVWKD
ncbi:MAG: OstA-like protein [Flavobacteriales bacterium]